MPARRLVNRIGPPIFALVAAALTLGRHFVLQAFVRPVRAPQTIECGANFSARYAAELGLDARQALADILESLAMRSLRLPVYWDEMEPEPGCFLWETLDWQMEAAGSAGASVLLCVGCKTPRYPEYHAPPWAVGLPEEALRDALLRFVEAAVIRFRDHPALEAWQVENEPLAGFGGWRYGEGTRDVTRWLAEEIRLVRSLDGRHPVMVSYADVPWMFTQLPATLSYDSDIIGVSVYSRTYFRSPFFSGYVDLTRFGLLGPLSLGYQRRLAAGKGRELWITELQAEPWPVDPDGLLRADAGEIARTMSRQQLIGSWEYAVGSGIGRVYLWGVEWLLHRQKLGLDLDIVDFVRGLGAGSGRDGGPHSSKYVYPLMPFS